MSDECTDMDDESTTIDVREPVTDRFVGALRLPATAPEVAQFIAHRAAECVGAAYSNLALLNRAGNSMRLYHGPLLDPSLVDRYTVVGVDAPFPIAAAVRDARPVLLPDLDAYRQKYPGIVADTVAAGVGATASIPLRNADGAVIGALGFAWPGSTAFDAKLSQALLAVAALCAESIERAERYDSDPWAPTDGALTLRTAFMIKITTVLAAALIIATVVLSIMGNIIGNFLFVSRRPVMTLEAALHLATEHGATLGAAARAHAEQEHSLTQVADAYALALETAAGADTVDDAVLWRIAEAAADVGIDDAGALARAAVDAGIVT